MHVDSAFAHNYDYYYLKKQKSLFHSFIYTRITRNNSLIDFFLDFSRYCMFIDQLILIFNQQIIYYYDNNALIILLFFISSIVLLFILFLHVFTTKIPILLYSDIIKTFFTPLYYYKNNWNWRLFPSVFTKLCGISVFHCEVCRPHIASPLSNDNTVMLGEI